MTTLDRKRPFGQTYGPVGHAYEQDGKKFDHEGKEVLSDEEKAARKAAEDADNANPLETLLEGSTAQVSDALAGLSLEQVTELVALETAGKARKGLLAALEADLAARKAAEDEVANQLKD